MKLFYTQNIGSFERIVRMIIGLAGITLGDALKMNWITIISIIILFTGFFGWCGLYTLRGYSNAAPKKAAPKKAVKTAKKKKKK